MIFEKIFQATEDKPKFFLWLIFLKTCLCLLRIKALKQKHEHEIEVIENEYKTELKKKQEETGRMIKLIVDGYELEMKRMKKKFISCSKLLSQAIHDIEVLNARNEKHSKTPNGVK